MFASGMTPENSESGTRVMNQKSYMPVKGFTWAANGEAAGVPLEALMVALTESGSPKAAVELSPESDRRNSCSPGVARPRGWKRP